jgi:hypothetical protein
MKINLNKKHFSIFESFKYQVLAQIFKRKANFDTKFIPNFKNNSVDDIKNYTGINPSWTYYNNIFWTPRFYIQKNISQEFLSEMRKFRKLDTWNETYQFALTQLILLEAIRDTSYELAYNYKISATPDNPFHGEIDILIYNTEEGSKLVKFI